MLKRKMYTKLWTAKNVFYFLIDGQTEGNKNEYSERRYYKIKKSEENRVRGMDSNS